MVAMNDKHRHINIAMSFELPDPILLLNMHTKLLFLVGVSEYILVEQLVCPSNGVLGGVDDVEQVPPQQDEVGGLLPGYLEDLFETLERVVSQEGVILLVAQMVVGGDDDPEVVLLYNIHIHYIVIKD